MITKRKKNLFKDRAHWITIWSRFIAGDRLAFDEIYSEYVDTLFAYGSKITNDKELVKDSIQDLFIDLYRYKIDLKKPESFEFYLFKSFKRLIYKKLKKNKEVINIDETEFLAFNLKDTDLKNEVEESRLEELQKALKEMKPRSRELLFYKFNSNLTYKEIGKLIGVNPDTVKKQVYRILIGLRKNFNLKLLYFSIMCFIAQ